MAMTPDRSETVAALDGSCFRVAKTSAKLPPCGHLPTQPGLSTLQGYDSLTAP